MDCLSFKYLSLRSDLIEYVSIYSLFIGVENEPFCHIATNRQLITIRSPRSPMISYSCPDPEHSHSIDLPIEDMKQSLQLH